MMFWCCDFQIYEIRSSLQHRNQCIVSILFTNLSSNHIKDLEFNVLDSLNTKMVRGVSTAISESNLRNGLSTSNQNFEYDGNAFSIRLNS